MFHFYVGIRADLNFLQFNHLVVENYTNSYHLLQIINLVQSQRMHLELHMFFFVIKEMFSFWHFLQLCEIGIQCKREGFVNHFRWIDKYIKATVCQSKLNLNPDYWLNSNASYLYMTPINCNTKFSIGEFIFHNYTDVTIFR